MQYPVVLRVTKLETFGNIAASGEHTWRERPTENADAARSHLNEDWRDVRSAAQLVAAVKQRVALSDEKTQQKRVPCLEYLISANALAFKEHGGSVDFREYFRDAVAWLEQVHGAQNIVAINVQLDELTPHLVVYVVPLLEEPGKKVKRSVIVGKNADGSQRREVRDVDKPGKKRLSAATFVDGGEKLSQMQSDFAEIVGKKHGLDRGLLGSTATHEEVQAWHARRKKSALVVPSLPTVVVPEPKIGALFSPLEYQKLAVKSVNEQLAPAVQAMTALAEDAKLARADEAAARRQAKVFERRALEAEAIAMHVKSQLATAEALLDLFTAQELDEAQLRRQEALAAAERDHLALLAQEQERLRLLALAHERQRRIDALPQLLKSSVGAALTFVQHAVAALKRLSGRADAVNWSQVEADSVVEAISSNGQEPVKVGQEICALSPARVDPASHAEVYGLIEQHAPQLQAEFMKSRGYGSGHGVEPQ